MTPNMLDNNSMIFPWYYWVNKRIGVFRFYLISERICFWHFRKSFCLLESLWSQFMYDIRLEIVYVIVDLFWFYYCCCGFFHPESYGNSWIFHIITDNLSFWPIARQHNASTISWHRVHVYEDELINLTPLIA